MLRWYEGPLAAFGTETTGTDVERDRIVSAALVLEPGAGQPAEVVRWLVDPGVPVPVAARAVHGLSEEFLRLYGRPPGPVLDELARELTRTGGAGVPLVVTDAPFGLTLLDRELRRHRRTGLGSYATGRAWSVLDPRVLDRHLDRNRAGSRTLTDLCEHYAVPLPGTHDAAADATASLALARAIGRRYAGRLGGLAVSELHARQAAWYAAQTRDHRPWSPSADRDADRDPAWPLRPDPHHAAA
jgi:DNA polymerase-3 subunit epsilon